MNARSFLFTAAASLLAGQLPSAVLADGLEPRDLVTPRPGTWPIYSGDYTGQRNSPLRQITRSNVHKLERVFAVDLDRNIETAIKGGEAKEVSPVYTRVGQVKGAILQNDGVLYISAPDNVWAIDARTGAPKWHFFWKSRGGNHVGNRGVGLWKNNIYFVTPDNYLVSLDAKTGKERWHVVLASLEEQYFSTTAPIIVGNHVMVGTGNDLDMPGYLQSFDADTGAQQWRSYMVPMNEGDPGLETWKDLDAARHGGGNPWMPGSYDAETGLYIIGTGNPSPAYFPKARGDKDALFTCSLVAIDVETGKIRWHYQTSPNDSHDWDSAQTPILADIRFGGRMRKVAMTAARNGYFFVVDRTTGEHLLTSKFSDTANWASGLNEKGQPVRIPEKDHAIGGALVSGGNVGAASWRPAAFSPRTGLFYVQVVEGWAMYYTVETDPRGGTGVGGKEEMTLTSDRYLKAIDPQTGRPRWSLRYPSYSGIGGSGYGGLLATAGGLLFGDDGRGNLVARDERNGRPLWHAKVETETKDRFGGTNAPITYTVDGKQYILIAGGTRISAYALP